MVIILLMDLIKHNSHARIQAAIKIKNLKVCNLMVHNFNSHLKFQLIINFHSNLLQVLE